MAGLSWERDSPANTSANMSGGASSTSCHVELCCLMPASMSLFSKRESYGRAEANGNLFKCDSPKCTRWLIRKLTRPAHPGYGMSVAMHR